MISGHIWILVYSWAPKCCLTLKGRRRTLCRRRCTALKAVVDWILYHRWIQYRASLITAYRAVIKYRGKSRSVKVWTPKNFYPVRWSQYVLSGRRPSRGCLLPTSIKYSRKGNILYKNYSKFVNVWLLKYFLAENSIRTPGPSADKTSQRLSRKGRFQGHEVGRLSKASRS